MVTQCATVVAGFPGIGKSHLTSTNNGLPRGYTVIDHDTSAYSHVNGAVNPHFPRNYIDVLISYLSRPRTIILVGVHDSVRDELVRNGIVFTLVYPSSRLKAEYMQRWIHRGSPQGFLNKMNLNWNGFIQGCQRQNGCWHIKLQRGQYLSDVVSSFL